MNRVFSTASAFLIVAFTLGVVEAQNEPVGLRLHNWYSSCDLEEVTLQNSCRGTTAPGPGEEIDLDLSGNFFCYVNPIEEVKSAVFWFSGCDGAPACDVAPERDIQVYAMYLNPTNEMYLDLLPTECSPGGACAFTEGINNIRGEDWAQNIDFCAGSINETDTNPPFTCYWSADGLYEECSVFARIGTNWSSTYCLFQANMSTVAGGTDPPTPSPPTSGAFRSISSIYLIIGSFVTTWLYAFHG